MAPNSNRFEFRVMEGNKVRECVKYRLCTSTQGDAAGSNAGDMLWRREE
jgi:hypothetical protein